MGGGGGTILTKCAGSNPCLVLGPLKLKVRQKQGVDFDFDTYQHVGIGKA